jgi:hypothetical protein
MTKSTAPSELIVGSPAIAPAAALDPVARRGFILLGVLALTHIAFTWGRIDLFMWRDVGRWLHEIERYAAGEAPYRDFAWQYPPLALWLLGSVARTVGAHVHVIWTVTSLVFLAICVGYGMYVSLLVPRPLVLPVLLAGFLFAVAYANLESAALPLGMYIPPAPIGFLLLILATALSLRVLAAPSSRSSALLGVLCALCMLTKQDFWLPAAYIVTVVALRLSWQPERTGRWAAFALVVGFGATLALGTVGIGLQSGWEVIPGMISGYGTTNEVGGKAYPSWQRLTIEAAMLAAIASMGWILVNGATPTPRKRFIAPGLLALAACGFALDAAMAYRNARPGTDVHPLPFVTVDPIRLSAARIDLIEQGTLHLLPVLTPLIVAALIAKRWRRFGDVGLRNTIAFLLGLCVMARARRGFERVDWFHFMLELPVYSAALMLFAPGAIRTLRPRAAGIGIVVIGMLMYWYLGIGPLTRYESLSMLRTPKGTIYVSETVAAQYSDLRAILARIDPGATRPVFAFGYNAAFNYFLDRPNPSPITVGFRLGGFDPEGVVAGVLAYQPPPVLIDIERFKSGRWPLPRFDIRSWGQPMTPSWFRRYDREYFDRLLRACPTEAGSVMDGERLLYTLYDCRAPAGASGRSFRTGTEVP